MVTQNSNVFQGRSLAVIADLSLDERLYLFEKTKELKEAWRRKDKEALKPFRIDDLDFGVYEVFLEDSTRTKESFKNAAEFHRVKHNELNTEHSSFNKSENYADTFDTLTGYDNHIFIVRSKLEGVCRWLEINGKEYAKHEGLPVPPSFINAGDGKHEHPTQELLDDFTFWEANGYDRSRLHIALIGDLLLSRTVHSKVDGLRFFDDVEVDLIAPQELSMPQHSIDRMKANGFEVRIFESLAEYYAQKHIALTQYFTRPQLERMGEEILKIQDRLRSAITFRKEFLDIIPERTVLYHPQPRYKEQPTIPLFLTNTPLNGMRRQSRNGKLIRINLLGLYAGRIGHDFKGHSLQRTEYIDDFVQEVQPREGGPKQYSEGVNPIRNGMVIDSICRKEKEREIRKHLSRVIEVLELYDGKGGNWVSESKKEPGVYKGIIFRPGHQGLDEHQIKRLAAVAPGCTLNMVKDSRVVKKLRLSMPPRIYGVEDVACKNDACISYPAHHEGAPAEFHREGGNTFVCHYCETPHTFKEIWGKL